MASDTDARHWEQVEEATELLMERQWQQALVALKEVLQSAPDNPYAYHYLGVAFFELKQNEAARDAYLAALRRSPDYLAARVALSHVCRLLGATQEALDHAKTALQLFADDGDALHARALAHAARGELSHARRFTELFLASNPPLEAQLEARSLIAMIAESPEGKPLELEGMT